jgi:hypothetical protein
MTGQAESVGNRRNFPLLRASQFVRAFADDVTSKVTAWLKIPEETSGQPIRVHAN